MAVSFSLSYDFLFLFGQALAADIKVFISVDRTVLEAFAPDFESKTGHKIEIHIDHATLLKKRLDGGETFDVAILTAAIAHQLTNEGVFRPRRGAASKLAALPDFDLWPVATVSLPRPATLVPW